MTENSSPSQLSPNTTGRRLRNLIIAAVAGILGVALFFGLQAQTASVSLQEQAEQSPPLEVAIANDQPTLMEFYADWCASCQAMAGELAELKADYADRVNFVMLDVDNNKWLPEILRYRIDGIPHFVYLDRQGEAIAQTIGEQPRSVFQADLEALIASAPLPYANAIGKTSEFNSLAQPSRSTDPRSHGSSVSNSH